MIWNNAARLIFKCGEKVKGVPISDKLSELKKNENLTKEQLQDIKEQKIRDILEYAAYNSPFYRNRIKKNQYCKQFITRLENWEPISKEQLKNNINEIASIPKIQNLKIAKTSGSTGVPLIFPKDPNAVAYHYAAMYRGHSWYDVYIGDREARLWGVPVETKQKIKTRIVDYLLNRFREKEYNLTEEILEKFYNDLNTFKPVYIMGYGKMICEFANFLHDTNRNLEHLNLRMVKYTSETITTSQHDLEQFYCCPVVSEYGSAETGIIAFQCPHGNHHIMDDCVHVEFINSDFSGCNLQEIVVTDLHNKAFPIIRYRLGDLIIPSEDSCSCNLPFPIVKKIQGRMSEIFYVVSNQGRKKFHSIIFYYIMKHCCENENTLQKFRVVHRAPNLFCYQLVASHRLEKIEKSIRAKTQQELGATVKVEFEYFSSLPRELSGKLKDFIPLVEND